MLNASAAQSNLFDPVAAISAAVLALQKMLFRHGVRSHRSSRLETLRSQAAPENTRSPCNLRCRLSFFFIQARAQQYVDPSLWNLRAARGRRLAPPQAPDFVSTLPSHQLSRSTCVAAGINTIRLCHPYHRPNLGHSTFRTQTSRVGMTATQSSLQLSRFLNELRGLHQSLRAMVAHAVSGTQRLQPVFLNT